MMRLHVVLAVVLVMALIYVFLCIIVYFRQARYVFVPDRVIEKTPADVGLVFEDITLLTSDGERLAAWYIPAPPTTPNPWTLLNCHGNGGDIGDRVPPLRTLHDLGLNVLIFDYRGYGNSTGAPTEQGTYEDARTAWRYLVEMRGTSPARTIAYGHSLGGAIAAWLAEQVHPAGLVLDATFTSAIDIGASMFPHLPIRYLSRFRYDTLERIQRINCPLLIAHGTRDETIPIDHSRRLFAQARDPKCYVESDGDHNDGGLDPASGYRDTFLPWLRELETSRSQS